MTFTQCVKPVMNIVVIVRVYYIDGSQCWTKDRYQNDATMQLAETSSRINSTVWTVRRRRNGRLGLHYTVRRWDSRSIAYTPRVLQLHHRSELRVANSGPNDTKGRTTRVDSIYDELGLRKLQKIVTKRCLHM